MGSTPRCFCGRPAQNTGSAFVCPLAQCPFRVPSTKTVSHPTSETCAQHGEPVQIINQPSIGHHPGRRFARCSLSQPNRCSYFRLIESTPAAPKPRQGFLPTKKTSPGISPSFFQGSKQTPVKASATARRSPPVSTRKANPSSQGEPSSTPQCRCNLPSVSRIVKAQGPNLGKTFFVCGNGVSRPCGFFEWARSSTSAAGVTGGVNRLPIQDIQLGRPASSRPRSDRATGNSAFVHREAINIQNADPDEAGEAEGEEAPNCVCGNSAVQRRVKKQGPNQGKFFFVCAKPKGEQCRFFEWAKKQQAQTAPSSVPNKRPHERPQSANLSDPAKRPRLSPRGKIVLDLEEIDTLSCVLHASTPLELREAAHKFPRAKFHKTEMLGAEKVEIPIRELSRFEQFMHSNAGSSVESKIPEHVVNRIIEFLDSEEKRETDGDVVTRSLDELLPPIVCEKLMQFQWHGVHFALKRGGRCLIGDDMGLGKTLQAIAVAKVYSSDWPLLVICPSSLRLNWKEEILSWLEEDVVEEDVLVMMTGKDVDRPLRRVTIVSYDLFRKVPERSLRRVNFVIADESHYLKSTSALRSKAVVPLVKRAKRALLLSGTPALSRPVELFPQINAILPKLFPSYREFVERYCAAHQGFFGYDVSGASNLSELHTLLRGSLLIRRKKEEVLTQLPDKQRQVMWVQTKPQLMKKVAQAMAEMEQARKAVAEAASEARAIVLQNAVKAAQTELYTLSGLAKLDGILEVCKDTADMGCKFIVFAHHTKILETLTAFATKKLKLGIIRIDGGTPQASRQALCKKFQTDPGCRIAILSITAAGVGLTLTQAKVVLFAELYWNPGSLLQAEDRAHRIGQKDCVLVKYLLARNTIDESMWSTVRRKLNVVGHSLTGTAGRMDVNSENLRNGVPKMGGIERFFQRKSQVSERASSQSQIATPDNDDDAIIESVNSTPALMPQTEAASPETWREDVSDHFPSLTPRNGKKVAPSLQQPRSGVLFSDLPDSVDLQESLQVQRRLDQDIALARRLQAQFDAEL